MYIINSPKAYEYIRTTFNSALPNPRTLRKWYECVDGSPGFTKESLNALRITFENKESPIICSLIYDEIDLKRNISFDGKKTYGYVDLGDGMLSETGQEASQALVFMIVAINGSWKIPVGYFLANNLNGSQKAVLVKECLRKVMAENIIVASITFDGAPSNKSMANILGCDLHLNNQNPTIIFEQRKIFIFYDPCHMIKLVRNAIGELKILNVGTSNKQICWSYVQKLHELQEQQGLHLANKLRQAHIEFQKQKMKVRLATQVFSDSLADAIEFCNKNL